MDGWLVIVLAFVTGTAVGYALHAHVVQHRPPHVPTPVAPTVVPFPYAVPSAQPSVAPSSPGFAVSLNYPDGTTQELTVPRRTYRLFYDGCAWEHLHSASGVWTYVPVDGVTPRQTQQRARTDG